MQCTNFPIRWDMTWDGVTAYGLSTVMIESFRCYRGIM